MEQNKHIYVIEIKIRGFFMEYTKDIMLGIRGRRGVGIIKLKNWTSHISKVVKNNKMIFSIIFSLTILVAIDILLVNSFLQLLMKVY